MLSKDKGSWLELNAAEQELLAFFDALAWDEGLTRRRVSSRGSSRSRPKLLVAAEALGYTESDWDAELHEAAAARGSRRAGGCRCRRHRVEKQAEMEHTAAAASGPPRRPAQRPSGKLQATYHGTKLILSDKSSTGYKGVCQRGESRFAVTYKGKCEARSTHRRGSGKYAEIIASEGSEDEPAVGGGGKGSSSNAATKPGTAKVQHQGGHSKAGGPASSSTAVANGNGAPAVAMRDGKPLVTRAWPDAAPLARLTHGLQGRRQTEQRQASSTRRIPGMGQDLRLATLRRQWRRRWRRAR